MVDILRELPTADMGVVDVYLLHPDNPQQGLGQVFVSGQLESFPDREEGVPLRIQSSCMFGEVMGSLDCDCGPQLAAARTALRGYGILAILNQEGRGVGIEAKIEAMELQRQLSIDTYEAFRLLGLPADQRDYGHLIDFLQTYRISRVVARTNNPSKLKPLEKAGLTVEREPLVAGVSVHNLPYLESKAAKGGHLLPADLRSYM